MDSLNTFTLKSNKKLKLNFDGGNLSSDAGLLLLKEFAAKIGFENLIRRVFKTNDDVRFRLHTDPDNLLQAIYQTIAAYFRDNDAVAAAYDAEGKYLGSTVTLLSSYAWNGGDEEPILSQSSDNIMIRVSKVPLYTSSIQ